MPAPATHASAAGGPQLTHDDDVGACEKLEIREADFMKSMFAAQTGLLTHDLSNRFHQDEDSKVWSGARAHVSCPGNPLT